MRLAWHIAWKDLRRLRWPLCLWGLLLAAKLVLGAVLLWRTFEGGKKGFDFFVGTEITVRILTVSECVAAFVLTAAILHGDVLTETTAFWQTRPISNLRLLLGKLLALAVIFAVIPCVICLPWWIACGFGVKEFLLGSLDTIFWLALPVAAAFPLAVLTNGFSRFLTWSFVVGFAFVCMGVMLLPSAGGSQAQALASGMVRAFAAVVLFLAMGVLSALAFFLRRR